MDNIIPIAIIPTGAILPYAGPIEPIERAPTKPVDPGELPAMQRRLYDAGWLLCDGRPVMQSVYPELFLIIGYAYGKQDTGIFYLPDLRGRFLRGVNLGAPDFQSVPRAPDESKRLASNTGGNTGGGVGSVQQDALQFHEHAFYVSSLAQALTAGEGTFGFVAAQPPPGGSWPTATLTGSTPLSLSLSGSDNSIGPTSQTVNAPGSVRPGQETVPKNVYVNFIIKHC